MTLTCMKSMILTVILVSSCSTFWRLEHFDDPPPLSVERRFEDFFHNKNVQNSTNLEAEPMTKTQNNTTLLKENIPKKKFFRKNKADVMTTLQKPVKLAVAIPTYNRAGYVKLCADALHGTIDTKDVWLFDDHSSDYSTSDLTKWFCTENIRRNKQRLKADRQARAVLEWFVKTEYDWLVTLDSDLIVHPGWVSIFKKMIPKTQGVISLYHSGNKNNHPTLKCDEDLCEMKTLGNAGVAWSRIIAIKMLSMMKQKDGFDWGWTKWLQTQKINQYAMKKSLVLHVGMHGTWGIDSAREKSIGFPMHTLSVDVRHRAEHFLKGAKPVDDTKQIENISRDNKKCQKTVRKS